MTTADAFFWKRKLAAFLHDSPSKPLDIQSHGNRAESALKRAGLIDDEGLKMWFDHGSDHLAAAADRLPFPHGKSGVRCHYDPQANPFRHPTGAPEPLRDDRYRLTAEGGEEIEQTNQPDHFFTGYPDGSAENWRSIFFGHWRLWREWATEAHAGFASLPADTRIPDHTIWNHMGVVSALAGCDGEPALLRFQIGPVQDFIAAARSTRDLWSGSFLLSWLMAAGLARLALILGPDSVIFPNLWGQPLLDLFLRDEVWGKLRASEATSPVWEGFGYPTAYSEENPSRPMPLHTPNLPNVFLAVVPANKVAEIALEVKAAIRGEWESICAAVRDYAGPLFAMNQATVAADASERFDKSTRNHLDIAWHALPLPTTPGEIYSLAKDILPNDFPEENPQTNDAVRRVEVVIDWFTKHMPQEHRDSRYYVLGANGPKDQLNNLGVAWSLAVALSSWQLDAVRSLRQFPGSSGPGPAGNHVASHGGKDALDGRAPMLFGGSQDWLDGVHHLPYPEKGDWKKLFRHPDEVGAITLVKRLWHLAYLEKKWKIAPHPMPNTYELASGHPERDDDEALESRGDEDGKYFAVLAFDGDSIGQWVGGAKTPPFCSQLADPGESGPRSYCENIDSRLPDAEKLLPLQRPLSPSYHLQFSEALSNFALHLAPLVVERYGGKLLYAGGDDVLAMLPAPHAIACANDLQRVFRGLSPTDAAFGIRELSPGFLSVRNDRLGRAIPLMLPGPRATASVGIAIAHFKQPLQDVVREAMAAEKRAKKLDKGKHAMGVTLIKRSGETIVWDTRFDADAHTPETDDSTSGPAYRGGPSALQWLLFAMGCDVGSLPGQSRASGDEVLSAKFPYRLSELLQPYAASGEDARGFDAEAVFARELAHTLDRQNGPDASSRDAPATRERLDEALKTHFRNLPKTSGHGNRIQSMLDLLATAAFLARQPHVRESSTPIPTCFPPRQ